MQSKIDTPKTHFLVYLSIGTLEQYMRSGITYVINTLITGSNRFVTWSFYVDQLVLLLDTTIKYFCIKKYKSTYPQYFYGFQREGSPIKPIISALVLSFYPYIKMKLDKYYTQLKTNKDYTEYTLFQKIFHNIFPLIHLITEGIDLVFKFRFLLDKNSQYFSLIFYLLKAKLVYKKMQESNSSAIMELLNKPFILILFLVYKILNWWYSSSRNSSSTNTTNTLVHPPFSTQDITKSNKCPVCSKKITHPAVISTSGHVFCYSCISNFVRDNKKCPLTSIKTGMDNIHIIY